MSPQRKRTPPDTSEAVDALMSALEHPHKPAVEALRRAILAADAAIAEGVKWNAPNFRFLCEDRVTFRLAPKGGLQVVFHRGAKASPDAPVAFTDDTGLIRWAAPDRGVITLRDAGDVSAHTAAIVAPVCRSRTKTSDTNTSMGPPP